MTAPSDRESPRQSAAFPHPLKVDDVPSDGLDMSIEAKPQECEAVARELGLPQVMSLAASVRVAPGRDGRFEVQGEVEARIAQVCVVSLERFESEVRQPIEVTFAPTPQPRAEAAGSASRHARRRGAVEAPPPPPAADADDPPDPIVDGRIDLGATAVEFLALALDFYPRKPGVRFTDVVIGETDEPQPSAFAALERLKDRS